MQLQRTEDGVSIAATPSVEEIARILALNPIFARFDRTSLIAAARKCGLVSFPAGATILRQGDPGSFAYLILDGEVDVFVEIAAAGPIHMSTLGRDNTIGELGAFTEMPRTATVVARTDVVALRVDREILIEPHERATTFAVDVVESSADKNISVRLQSHRQHFTVSLQRAFRIDTAIAVQTHKPHVPFVVERAEATTYQNFSVSLNKDRAWFQVCAGAGIE